MIDLNPASIALFFVAFHMVGDYITQTNWMAANKFLKRGPKPYFHEYGRSFEENAVLNFGLANFARTLHVLLYTIPFAVLAAVTLPTLSAVAVSAAVFIPHWIIDCRRWASPDPWPPKPIMVDQALHALHLAIVFAVFYGAK
jgi:hypothetical protein